MALACLPKQCFCSCQKVTRVRFCSWVDVLPSLVAISSVLEAPIILSKWTAKKRLLLWMKTQIGPKWKCPLFPRLLGSNFRHSNNISCVCFLFQFPTHSLSKYLYVFRYIYLFVWDIRCGAYAQMRASISLYFFSLLR